jgi:ATP-dependent DNA ligase
MVKAELLQDADEGVVRRTKVDPRFVWQEKHNGDRRLIEKKDGVVKDYNRRGETGKGLPDAVRDAIRNHPLPSFIIDVELVKDKIFVFDMLSFGDNDIMPLPYRERLKMLSLAFKSYEPVIYVIWTAWTREEKENLEKYLHSIRAEGFVIKDLEAPYRPSVSSSQRWNWRRKFIKTCDCVVIGPSPKGHESVRVGLFDDQGKLYDIGGISLIGKEKLTTGDIVEVKYLWASRNNHINQPRLVHKRTDKELAQCTLSQLVKGKGQ